jgi:hypothetical protein
MIVAAFCRVNAMDTIYVNDIRQIVSECKLERDTTPHVFLITHHKSDLQSSEWLDTSSQWLWINGGISVYKNGGWQRYIRPRYSVIDMGVVLRR